MRSFFLNRVLLAPYLLTLKLRHFLYDRAIFASYSFDIPVIAVGNISAGGTGKTPHTEYLVRELMESERVAVLSRGYGRKSKGFRFVEVDDRGSIAGDEPLQIKRKFPQITVAVDGDRVRGINKLLSLPQEERPTIILLDDGFQHRRVTPKSNILLIEYSNPPFMDNLLPFGTLRDLPSQMERAEIVVITKAPPGVSREERFLWRDKLALKESQKLLFTTIKYGEAEAIFEEGDRRYLYSPFAILLTAIANPLQLEHKLSSKYKLVSKLTFRDHKNFTKRDIKRLTRRAKLNMKAAIITTEKDAQRLREQQLSPLLKSRLFYFPIEVEELGEEEKRLAKLI